MEGSQARRASFLLRKGSSARVLRLEAGGVSRGVGRLIPGISNQKTKEVKKSDR